MPRVTKDVKNEELEKETSTVKKPKATRKQTTKKAEDSKEKRAKSSTATTKKSKTSTAKKVATKEKKEKAATVTTAKKKTIKASKETKTKSTTTVKKSKATTAAKEKTSKPKKVTTSKSRKLESNIIAEYYDLPYRYNETVVKILYQTPTILFVYWDISDYDRAFLQKEYGDNFFASSKPILKVFNLTKNYYFEIEINDFANSWYIHVPNPNCEYKVELDRKTIPDTENVNEAYIYISSSNDIEIPNDHILIDELPDKLRFKNIKTNAVSIKDITTLRFIGISKIYNIYDFYKRFYNDDIWEEINNRKMLNPSSMFSS